MIRLHTDPDSRRIPRTPETFRPPHPSADGSVGRPADRRGNRLRGRGGFSLVELIIAMMVLTVGLLGLAAGTGYVIRSAEMGRIDTERAQARQSAVELVRARGFEDLVADEVEIGAYEVSWEIVEDLTNSRIVEITITGPGRGATGPEGGVEESFRYRVNRTGGG